MPAETAHSRLREPDVYKTHEPFASLPSGPRACNTPRRMTFWPVTSPRRPAEHLQPSLFSICKLYIIGASSITWTTNSARYRLRRLLRILQVLTLRDCVTWRTSSPLSSLQALLKTLSLKLSMDSPRDPPSKKTQGLGHGVLRSWSGTSHPSSL